MTGAGAPGAAGIIKCLHQNPKFNVIGVDANKDAVGQHLLSEFQTIPFAEEEQFIPAVLNICREKNIHALLPLVTRELIPLASHYSAFEAAGTKLPISSQASLEIANNKSRLYEFLQWRNIPVPGFRVVETVEQFREAASELGYPQKTICFKPSVSNGSRGFRIISEKINETELLFDHKPNSVHIRMEQALALLSAGKFPELLVSEYLSGPEYSIDCLANRGESILILPRLRIKMVEGISVAGEFQKEDDIINYCGRIIRELQLHGNVGIQVKRTETGECLLLEINPRVQGSISACLGAGINLPELAVKQELGIKISANELQPKWGVKFSRYWSEVFY